MFKCDRNCFGGGLYLYVKDQTTKFTERKHRYRSSIFINKYVKKKMALLKHLQTSKQNDSQFLEYLSNNLSIYLKDSDNILLLGDFNTNLENRNLQHLTDSSNLENSIHEVTCFRKSEILL